MELHSFLHPKKISDAKRIKNVMIFRWMTTMTVQARRKLYGNAGFGRRTFLLPRYVFLLDEEKK